MGFEVVAIARGTDKAALAKELGAHHYIDSGVTNPAKALQALGGAAVVLATASAGKAAAENREGIVPGRRGDRARRNGGPIEISSLDLL
jgi:propanol-preferring alcohol dehydrogenase